MYHAARPVLPDRDSALIETPEIKPSNFLPWWKLNCFQHRYLRCHFCKSLHLIVTKIKEIIELFMGINMWCWNSHLFFKFVRGNRTCPIPCQTRKGVLSYHMIASAGYCCRRIVRETDKFLKDYVPSLNFFALCWKEFSASGSKTDIVREINKSFSNSIFCRSIWNENLGSKIIILEKVSLTSEFMGYRYLRDTDHSLGV